MSQGGISAAGTRPRTFLGRGLGQLSLRPSHTGVLREGVWVALGQAGSALGLLLGTRLLTEYLAPDVFGSANLLLGLSAFGSCVLSVPLMQAALRFYPDLKTQPGGVTRLRAVLFRCLLITTGGFVALILCGGLVNSHAPDTWALCGVLAALVVLDTLKTLETSLFNAARRQAPASLWVAAEAWLRPAVAIGLIWVTGASLLAVLSGYLVASLAVFAVFALASRPEGDRLAYSLDDTSRSISREIWSYTLPLMPLAVVAWVISASDRYIIGGMLGLETAGIYIAAYALASRPMSMLLATVEMTLRPLYYEAIAAGNARSERKVFLTWLAVLTAACGLLTIFIWLASDWIVLLLLGKQYRSAAALMPWLALGNMLWVLGLTYHRRLFGHKKTTALLVLRTLAAVLTLAVMTGLTYLAGLRGAAIACPIYGGLELLIFMVYSQYSRQANPGGTAAGAEVVRKAVAS